MCSNSISHSIVITRYRSRGRGLMKTINQARLVFVAVATLAAAACNAQMVLTQQVEARRLASNLRVQFTMASDAANRSVMSETDDAATAAAREAEQATQAALRDVDQLRAILKSM